MIIFFSKVYIAEVILEISSMVYKTSNKRMNQLKAQSLVSS